MVLSALKSFLKLAFFTAVVLLLGQIVIGNNTVGARFHRWVSEGWRWGSSHVRQTKVFAGFTAPDIVNHWFHNIYPPHGGTKFAGKEESQSDQIKERSSDPDGITASDRESLLRLLH